MPLSRVPLTPSDPPSAPSDPPSTTPDSPSVIGVAAAVERARSFAGSGRRLLGLVGAPGAGKSTLAALLVEAVPGAVLVPMDGFHLTTAALRALGSVERRGAPDTFDADGYVALLQRLRAAEVDVFAPGFDRSVEEPVPDAFVVPRSASLVITEGNYLLLGSPPWVSIAGLLDEIWFVDVAEEVRVRRLVARFASFGWDEVQATERVLHGTDASNARLVAATRVRADLAVDLGADSGD